MPLFFYNFLTKKIEQFTPINPPQVGFYTCGPTTYDFAHIGNLRTFIFEDILQRVLEANGYQVNRVMNITDIEDKIIKGAKEKGLDIKEFSAPYEKAFFEDLNKLNIKSANNYPKATEHIGKMIKYIEQLIEKGLAYEQDGSILGRKTANSVYFDISKFPDYGKLSGVQNRELKSGTRILSDEYSKDDVQDFALWKAVEADEVGWDSPWGRGRPGWHIECSVMAQEYLGESFDIHGGGIDLLFPHHENEIAQAEGKTGKKFVNFFVEGEHLLVVGAKMAKSAGNFYKLKDLEEKGIDPLAFRYLNLSAHYRDRLNFTWESLSAAQSALNHLRSQIRALEQPKGDVGQFYQRFAEAANLDLNMPQALAILHEMVSSDIGIPQKARDLMEMDKILGLKLDEYLGKPLEVPKQVLDLVEKRETARKSGDFELSDLIRKEIKDLGFEIEDTSAGPVVKSK